MTRVAVSGHRGLAETTVRLVDREIRAVLAKYLPDLVGLSCLADGADQLFARAVLDLGGKLEVIIPAEQYRDGLPNEAKPGYDALFANAAEVHRIAFVESTSAAHQAASEYMVNHAVVLLAVWDGKPSRGYGGTADVVAFASDHGVPVEIVWPAGAVRD